jgi:hypothetical protein
MFLATHPIYDLRFAIDELFPPRRQEARGWSTFLVLPPAIFANCGRAIILKFF